MREHLQKSHRTKNIKISSANPTASKAAPSSNGSSSSSSTSSASSIKTSSAAASPPSSRPSSPHLALDPPTSPVVTTSISRFPSSPQLVDPPSSATHLLDPSSSSPHLLVDPPTSSPQLVSPPLVQSPPSPHTTALCSQRHQPIPLGKSNDTATPNEKSAGVNEQLTGKKPSAGVNEKSAGKKPSNGANKESDGKKPSKDTTNPSNEASMSNENSGGKDSRKPILAGKNSTRPSKEKSDGKDTNEKSAGKKTSDGKDEPKPSNGKFPPPRPPSPTRRSSRQINPKVILEQLSSSSSSEDEGEGEDSPQLETDEDYHNISSMEAAMEAAGLIVVSPAWLRDNKTPLLLVCRASKCLKGINVQNGIAHATRREDGGHGLRVSKEVVVELEKWIGVKAHLFLSSETAFREAPGPQVTPKPLPILKVQPGFRCTSHNCSYCCLKPRAMATHWSEERNGKRAEKKSKKAKVQTFFESHPRYLAVNPSLSGLPANSCYELYLTQLIPDLENDCREVVPYLASEREVPPLLKVMQWHEHLSPYLLDKTETEASDEPPSKDSQQLSLFSLPKVRSIKSIVNQPECRHLRRALCDVVDAYLLGIKKRGKSCEPRVRRMLQEYPLASNKADFWSFVSDKTLHNYGLVFQKLTNAVLSHEDHPYGYTLPLSDDDKLHASELHAVLKKRIKDTIDKEAPPVGTEELDTFHQFIKPFLYPFSGDSGSRWDDPMERFFALHALQDDGTFRSGDGMTQLFAHLSYLMRSTFLYEALLRVRKAPAGTLDLDKAVEEEVSRNISPGIRSRFNTVGDHQAIAMSIALVPNQAPTTRASEDGMHITHRETHLDIELWRNGLLMLCDEVENEIESLCGRQDFGLSIPDWVPDDWADRSQGYSWTKNGTFLDDNRCLIKFLLNDQSSNLATVNSHGRLEFNMVEVRDTLQRCDSINRKLALLTLLTAGQISRIAEFVDYQSTNSIRGRHLFRDGKDIWVVNRRTKTEGITGKESFIPKKCHPRLSRALEKYLLIIRPLEKELGYRLYGKEAYHFYSRNLWIQDGKKMTEDNMYRHVEDCLRDYCGVAAGIQVYRQLCVEIGRVFLGSESEFEEEKLDVLASQMAHTARMAQVHYANEVYHLPAMSSDLLLRYGRVSEAWWTVIGLKPGAAPMLPLRERQEPLQEDIVHIIFEHGPKEPTPTSITKSCVLQPIQVANARRQFCKLRLATPPSTGAKPKEFRKGQEAAATHCNRPHDAAKTLIRTQLRLLW